MMMPTHSLEPHLQTLNAPIDEFGFWLERPSGFSLLFVKNLNDVDSAAYIAGVRNGDVVVKINGQPVWELTVGEALLLLIGDGDASGSTSIRIDWIPAVHAALAQRVVRQLRSQASTRSSQSSAMSTAVSSRDVDWDAVRAQSNEERRRRNLHENMSPEQADRHRQRNRRDNMTPEQVENHRRRNLHEEMNEEQVPKCH